METHAEIRKSFFLVKCLTPYTVENPRFKKFGGQRTFAVRCGRCPNCLRYRAAQWSFRLMQEDKVAKHSAFITLTYDGDHVPITPNGFMSLRPRDLTLFWKRLRKLSGEKLRYYACGEYGGRYRRPHYHAVLFGLSDSGCVAQAWQVDGRAIGLVHVGNVSSRSVMYTVNYMNKPRYVPEHKRDDRVQEFSRMSRGLGEAYLSPAIVAWYKRNLHRQFVLMPDKWKAPLPRYYKERMYTDEERQILAFLARTYDPGEIDDVAVMAALEKFNANSRRYEERTAF